MRPLSDTVYYPKSQSVGIQVQVADAALKLRTARLHAFEIAEELDCCAATGRTVDSLTARQDARPVRLCRPGHRGDQPPGQRARRGELRDDQPDADGSGATRTSPPATRDSMPLWATRSSEERYSGWRKGSARSCDPDIHTTTDRRGASPMSTRSPSPRSRNSAQRGGGAQPGQRLSADPACSRPRDGEASADASRHLA